MRKILLILLFAFLFLPLVSAFDWDNVGTYYPETKTMEIKNCLGIPLCDYSIANITLLSPQDMKVIAGEERLVAWYEIDNFGTYDGNSIFSIVDTYNLKRGNSPIQKNIVFKKQKIELEEVPVYKEQCEEVNAVNGTSYQVCESVQIGTEEKEIIEWNAFNINSDLLTGKVIIGLFTEVEPEEKVEWIPKMFGVTIDEWASWTEALNDALVVYYSFEHYREGTNVRDISNNALNLNGTIADTSKVNYTATGKIGYGMKFNSGNDVGIASTGNIGITGDSSLSIFFWINITDASQVGTISWSANGDVNNQQRNIKLRPSDTRIGVIGRNNDDYFATTGFATASTGWSLIGVIYDNATSNVSVYVDGVRKGTASPDDYATTDGIVRIGYGVDETEPDYLEGELDEIGVWSRIITQAEITQLYNGGAGITYALPNVAPSVTSNLPANNTNYSIPSITINCSATDDYGLRNISLYIDGTLNQTVWNVSADQLYIDIETTETFGTDGSYLWNCVADDSATPSLTASSSERNFTIDTTSPTITGTWNLTNLTTYSLPINSTWNYTASDLHLDSCWYNTTDDATTVSVTCNSTIVDLQWATQGDKTVYYYVNDTFGFETYESKLINIAYISSDYYHTPDLAGEGGSIFFELYVNKTNIETTTAYLFFNDTTYDPDSTEANTDYYYFNYTFDVPDVWGNTTGKEYDYNWNFTIASVVDNRSTATDNFTIWAIDFDDCTTYGQLILNFSLRDEEGNTYINSTDGSNVEIDLTLTTLDGLASWKYNDIWSNNATGSAELDALVCMPYEILNNTNYTIDYTIGFDSTDHVWEFLYLENGSLNYHEELLNSLTNRTKPLMDLLSADSTSFLFNYFDEDGLVVDNIIVHTFRQYIGEGIFREIERSKQNDDGDTIIHLVEEDVIYYFIVSQNGTILYTSSTYTALCQTTPCEIQLEESGGFVEFSDDWDLIDNGGYLISASSSTRLVNLNYTLTSPSTMNITLYKLVSDGTYSVIGSNQSTGIQDDLVVFVPTISGNTSFFVTIEQDGDFVKSQWVDLESDAGVYFGNTLSLFLGAIIILTFGLIAITEGSGTIIFLILGMLIAMVLGLVDYRTSAGVSVLIYFIVSGGIIIWKLTRRNR